MAEKFTGYNKEVFKKGDTVILNLFPEGATVQRKEEENVTGTILNLSIRGSIGVVSCTAEIKTNRGIHNIGIYPCNDYKVRVVSE